MDIEKYVRDIKNKLRKDGYVGKLIDYEELKELHQTYGSNMEEKTFAGEVLGITYSNYMTVKNSGTRAKILKNFLKQLSEGEIEEIQEELKEKEYAGKSIDYEEFKKIYETYGKQMEEKTFAGEVLGISYDNYMSLKNKGTKAKILKDSLSKVSKEEIKEIQEKLKQAGDAGKLINYEELKELHQTYGKEMEEKTFAREVLGILDSNYRRMRYHEGARAKIQKYVFNKTRKKEIQEICQENNITIDEFIEQFLSNYSKYTQEYKETIEKGKIWIGKTRLSDDFIKRNYEKMRKLAERSMVEIKGKYWIDYNKDEEDEIEDSILNVIENRGDIERNFEGKQEMLDMMLYTSIRRFIRFRVLEKKDVTAKTLSLNKKYGTKQEDGKELQEGTASKENTEEELIQPIEKKQKSKKEELKDLSKQCIEELKKQTEKGASREEALNNTSEKLGMEKQEMLEAMQTYLITKGSVKILSGKNVSWSEGEEER